MRNRILIAIITVMLLAFGLARISPASANEGTPPRSDSFRLLVETIIDVDANNLLSGSLGDLLIDWTVENLIAPHTGEFPLQVIFRLAPGPVVMGDLMPGPRIALLTAALTDAYEKNLINESFNDLLAGWFIEDLIAPHTGETPEQVRSRLKGQRATPPTSAEERDALVAFYHATNGSTWIDNTNWLSDKPVGEWVGVTTDYRGRVTKLWSYGNGISGRIPPEISNLSNLTSLYIYDHPFTEGSGLIGRIPRELGNLSNMERLTLGFQRLSGPIPPELGNLTNLKSLTLQSNRLSGPIPAELGNLTNLESLRLEGNWLSGQIPEELGNLSNLAELELRDNRLGGQIPKELGNLFNLEALYLGGNQLSGPIPPELGKMENMAFLHFSGNQLSGPIPPELGNLSNLGALYLERNRLSGHIPKELANLPNLMDLYLRGNRLTGCIPYELANIQYSDLHILGIPFCPPQDNDESAPPGTLSL